MVGILDDVQFELASRQDGGVEQDELPESRAGIYLPKRGKVSQADVERYYISLGLNNVRETIPGVISPWRMAIKVAYFRGDLKKVLGTIPQEHRDFYQAVLPLVFGESASVQ